MSYSKQFSVESLAKFYAREEHESCVIPITIFTCHVIVKRSLPAETSTTLRARLGLIIRHDVISLLSSPCLHTM